MKPKHKSMRLWVTALSSGRLAQNRGGTGGGRERNRTNKTISKVGKEKLKKKKTQIPQERGMVSQDLSLPGQSELCIRGGASAVVPGEACSVYPTGASAGLAAPQVASADPFLTKAAKRGAPPEPDNKVACGFPGQLLSHEGCQRRPLAQSPLPTRPC